MPHKHGVVPAVKSEHDVPDQAPGWPPYSAPSLPHARLRLTCVPVPTNEQKSDLFAGKRNTSPWMYFQPDSSSSMAAADSSSGSRTTPAVKHSRHEYQPELTRLVTYVHEADTGTSQNHQYCRNCLLNNKPVFAWSKHCIVHP